MTQPQSPPTTAPHSWRDNFVYPLGAVGALLGALLGALIVKWASQSSFYFIPAIGLAAGWGAALLSGKGGWTVAILAALIAALTGLYAEWKFYGPMKADPSFPYFLTHLTGLTSFKLFIHAVNVAIAFWFGLHK